MTNSVTAEATIDIQGLKGEGEFDIVAVISTGADGEVGVLKDKGNSYFLHFADGDAVRLEVGKLAIGKPSRCNIYEAHDTGRYVSKLIVDGTPIYDRDFDVSDVWVEGD